MSQQPQGEGWWQASDLLWYPPQQQHPAPPPPPQYGQPQYGQPQYGQPQYGAPQYGQPQHGMPYVPPAPPPRKNNAAVIIVAVVLALVLIPVGAAIVVFAVGGSRTSSAELAACKIDARTLRTAEEAIRADRRTDPSAPPPGYVSMEELVAVNFLEQPSDHHRIVLDGPSGSAASYSLVKIGRCKDLDYTP